MFHADSRVKCKVYAVAAAGTAAVDMNCDDAQPVNSRQCDEERRPNDTKNLIDALNQITFSA